MYQIIEQTYEEKFKMYKKLSKKELIKMLLENQRLVEIALERNKVVYPEYETDFMRPPYAITFGDTCSCNPLNGGSGICGCTMGNQIIKK